MKMISQKKLIILLNGMMYERFKAVADEKGQRETVIEGKLVSHIINVINGMPSIEVTSKCPHCGAWMYDLPKMDE